MAKTHKHEKLVGQLIIIEWDDAASYSGWSAVDETLPMPRITSVGWLLTTPTEEHPSYRLARDIDTNNSDVSGDNTVIPQGMLVSITPICGYSREELSTEGDV